MRLVILLLLAVTGGVLHAGSVPPESGQAAPAPSPSSVPAAVPEPRFEFQAMYYKRDLSADTLTLKGNAYLKRDRREIWADEIILDYKTNRAVANGKVHIREGALEAWCVHGGYNMKGEDATLEEATLTVGQLVMTGAVIRRLDMRHFEIDEGSYSNCNVDLIRSKDVKDCSEDWKLYGHFFSITVDGYAHVHDAIFYVRKLPVFYTPYFIASMKTTRDSGFLWPNFYSTATLGSGVTLPYFLNLAPWQDVTIWPTYFSSAGYHVGATYRYIYAPDKMGNLSAYVVQRRFTNDPDHPYGLNGKGAPKYLGLFGEGAINGYNNYSLGGRNYSRMAIRLVSHPYYTYDYAPDVGPMSDLGYLRSNLSVNFPSDTALLAGNVQYLQSLVISHDTGVDQGAPVELPTLIASHETTSLAGRFLSYDADARFTNWWRPAAFDSVPLNPVTTGSNLSPSPVFGGNDYLRTGQRLQIEPRLIANVPMPKGFQLQPLLDAGTLLYHFSLPKDTVLSHQYVETSIPFSVYLNRTFETGIPGFEKVNHVFQPRFIYARSFYESPQPDHPFFYVNQAAGLSNPRFDITDQFGPYEYMRFELINRFRRKDPKTGGVARFWLFQLSEQYNMVLNSQDPRYQRHLGPIEILSQLDIWRFSLQVQGLVQVEQTTMLNGIPLPTPVRENQISTSIVYTGPGGDNFRVDNVMLNTADPSLVTQSLIFSAYKYLPTFFDVNGSLEYNMHGVAGGQLMGYFVGLDFHSKPRSCWDIAFTLGRNSFLQPFAFVNFHLFFGSPNTAFNL